MQNEKIILDYVDEVMAGVKAPESYKAKLENNLIRRIIISPETRSTDQLYKYFGEPDILAAEMNSNAGSELMITEGANDTQPYDTRCRPQERGRGCPPPQRQYGEYMREENNINLKLLYIPLIQISSGTERIRMPLTDDNNYYYG